MFLLFSFVSFANSKVKMKIIKTPILSFVPQFKQHHVVIIQNERDNLYAIDFSPTVEPISKRLFLLFMAKNVPAEIRVRKLEKVNIEENDKIIEEWKIQTNQSAFESKKITETVIKKIKNAELIKILDKVKLWNSSMNVYTHNCQHFSSFIKNNLQL
jgi:hypothetical protein